MNRPDDRFDPRRLAAYRAAGLGERSRIARAGAAALGRALRRALAVTPRGPRPVAAAR